MTALAVFEDARKEPYPSMSNILEAPYRDWESAREIRRNGTA